MKNIFIYLIIAILSVSYCYAVEVSNDFITISSDDTLCSNNCLSYIHMTVNKDILLEDYNKINYYIMLEDVEGHRYVSSSLNDNVAVSILPYAVDNPLDSVSFKLVNYEPLCELQYSTDYDGFKYIDDNKVYDCYNNRHPADLNKLVNIPLDTRIDLVLVGKKYFNSDIKWSMNIFDNLLDPVWNGSAIGYATYNDVNITILSNTATPVLDFCNRTGYAYYYNGASSITDFSNFSKLSNANNFSLSFWLYKNDTFNFGNDRILYLGNSSQYQFNVYGMNGALTLRFNIATNNSDTDCQLTSPSVFSQLWQYYAVTWNGTVCKLFVNGTNTQNDSTTSNKLKFTDGTKSWIGYSSSLVINGTLSDFRLYNSTMTQVDVNGIFDDISNCNAIPSCTENWLNITVGCDGIINQTQLLYTDLNVCNTTINIPVGNGSIQSCCVENWVQNNTQCLADTYYINYVDVNSCGTTFQLPLDDGNSVSCLTMHPNLSDDVLTILILFFMLIISTICAITVHEAFFGVNALITALLFVTFIMYDYPNILLYLTPILIIVFSGMWIIISRVKR